MNSGRKKRRQRVRRSANYTNHANRTHNWSWLEPAATWPVLPIKLASDATETGQYLATGEQIKIRVSSPSVTVSGHCCRLVRHQPKLQLAVVIGFGFSGSGRETGCTGWSAVQLEDIIARESE